MSWPKELSRGQVITAEWLNSLLRESKRNEVVSSPGALVSRLNQTTVTPIRTGGGATDITRHFYVSPSAPDEGQGFVDITGGTLHHPYNGVRLSIPDAVGGEAWPVNDGDRVWLERTGPNEWEFNTGPDYPVDKLAFPLVDQIAVDEDGIVSIDEAYRRWDGGDLIIPEVFPVAISSSSGNAGNIATDCSFTYAVATLDGVGILGGASPVNIRTSKCEYSAGTKGLAWITVEGEFEFYALDEAPVGVTLEKVITDVIWDGSSLKLKYRKMTILAADDADTEETIDTADTCPA